MPLLSREIHHKLRMHRPSLSHTCSTSIRAPATCELHPCSEPATCSSAVSIGTPVQPHDPVKVRKPTLRRFVVQGSPERWRLGPRAALALHFRIQKKRLLADAIAATETLIQQAA